MSELIDALLSGVGFVGNVLDTPGALVRNTLSGRNPFAGLNPFDPEGRASGRDMLQSWGILDDNQEGFDWGDVAGFGAELVTDPLNLLGAGAAKNTARLAKEARAANASNDLARQVVQRASDFYNAGSALPSSRIEDASRFLTAQPSQQTIERILLAPPEEAAQILARNEGWHITGNPGRDVSDFYRHSEATPFGVSESTARKNKALAFVTQVRPDLAFFGPERYLQGYGVNPIEVPAHEMLHNMVGMYPETFPRLASSLGDDALSEGWNAYTRKEYTPSPFRLEPLDRTQEEGMATIFQRASRRMPQGRDELPLRSMLAAGDSAQEDAIRAALADFSESVRIAAKNNRLSIVPPNPGDAASIYSDFLLGNADQLGTRTLYGPELGESVSSAVRYAPLPADPLSFIPANSPVPSQVPLLAALLGHNALARGSQF